MTTTAAWTVPAGQYEERGTRPHLCYRACFKRHATAEDLRLAAAELEKS